MPGKLFRRHLPDSQKNKVLAWLGYWLRWRNGWRFNRRRMARDFVAGPWRLCALSAVRGWLGALVGGLALLAGGGAVEVLADTPPTGAWRLLPELSDEFAGAKIDPAKWETRNAYYLGRKPGLIHPDNVVLKDGMLQFWTRLGVPPNSPPGYRYTTGYLRSVKPLLYGYLEMRAKVAPVAVDQAFVLYSWSKTEVLEIDVFEMAPGAKGHERTVHTNTHAYHGPPELESDETRVSDPLPWAAPFDPTADFHVYGLEWDALTLRFYVDNRLIREKLNTDWHLPMPISLGSEIIEQWFGLPTDKSLPTHFLVDYVRVWERRQK